MTVGPEQLPFHPLENAADRPPADALYETAAVSVPSWAQSEDLTHRELEIAHPVADGLTDRHVSARLNPVVRTIDSHLEHIRGKLGVRSRAGIAPRLKP